MGETGTPAQNDPLGLLLAVQEKDLFLDQLAYRRQELPERAHLAEIDDSVAALRQRAGELGARQDLLAKRQTEIEGHIESYSKRIEAIEARLRQGSDYRDAQAMSGELDSLARHKRGLEDDELDVMEALEPAEKELSEAEAELVRLAAARTEAAEALSAAEREIDKEAGAIARQRAQLAAGLPAELASTYERLRERLGGVGAAKLIDGHCSGCHLALPTSERDRLSRAPAGTVAYCDQCGRILVP